MTDVRQFLRDHTARIEPMSRDLHLAYWTATITGRSEDFSRFAELDIALQTVYTDAAAFRKVRAWHDAGIDDDIERRQVDILYRRYLRNQIDPQLIETMTRLSTDIINRFNVYRVEVDGQTFTSNEVKKILKTSRDGEQRRRVWEADKGVGDGVWEDLVELARLRNRAARDLGFETFYTMSLELSEQTESEIITTFDRLEELTREPFREARVEIDAAIAASQGIGVADLCPWHYHDPFFQEVPEVFDLDLDAFYRGRDILDIVRRFYEDIGLEVESILAASDLYEKPGKEQHAYCMDIDRHGDIRVLANIRDDESWTGTMLHELGHAVYDRYVDPGLPFLLREHAHVFATEAVAMYFGRLSKDPAWIRIACSVPDRDIEAVSATLEKKQRIAQLVFARWCQVMVRFERELYRDPDQDLGALWWSLVECYQMITPPPGRSAPDWASKIHIVSAPVYYHNYMLGEMLASQFDRRIQRDVLGAGAGERRPVNGRREVGEWMREKVFASGRRYRWDDVVRRATGESLSPDCFVDQFVSV